jgi:hypothetical protein
VQFTLAKLCHHFGNFGFHFLRVIMLVAARWPFTGSLGFPTATMMVTGTPFLDFGALDILGALELPYIMIFSLVIQLR